MKAEISSYESDIENYTKYKKDSLVSANIVNELNKRIQENLKDANNHISNNKELKEEIFKLNSNLQN